MWSVSTILTGLYSFMVESGPTLGSIDTTTSKKREFARKSLDFNMRDPMFCRLFPEYVELHQAVMQKRREAGEVIPDITADPPVSHERQSTSMINNLDMNGIFAAAAGLIAIFSIVFAMRFV